MKFHPLTHIIVAIEMALIMLILPVHQGLGILILWLLAILCIPGRTGTNLTGAFIKILIIAAFFLFLIHGVKWRPLGISPEGTVAGLIKFLHIAAPVMTVMYLSKMVHSEEIFALLIDLRIPPVVILILFRTLWLVPRFTERVDEVITAQKLRGVRIESTSERIRALLPTLNPIFSSMFEEISENSLTLTARGFLNPGRKSHLNVLKYGWPDGIFLAVITLIFVLSWF
ncbi:MAG: energy-coupling factor transporter transmembrane protein EcfT [Candidatus Latescibacteria bacterium]|jgi:energy-coupling factor transporter transmembrane protein EcfT|nr:energy-coupling factor transporter transmembrane protein EcfT [Candidatus Latescibacterota bacterium]